MKIVRGFSLALIFTFGLFAQYHGGFGGAQPIVTGGFGNILNPAGTAATNPYINRFTSGTGGIVLPNGSPRLVIPGSSGVYGGAYGAGRRSTGSSYIYAYPAYIGSYGYPYSYGYDPNAAPAQTQPNVTVVYPPQPAPVIINQYGPGTAPPGETANPSTIYPSGPPDENATQAPEPTHYLIAFKDHTVYSAIAYWVQGDTLHYFTSGNTHNQVSLSLVDRDLTERLNRESGVTINLTPTQQPAK